MPAPESGSGGSSSTGGTGDHAATGGRVGSGGVPGAGGGTPASGGTVGSSSGGIPGAAGKGGGGGQSSVGGGGAAGMNAGLGGAAKGGAGGGPNPAGGVSGAAGAGGALACGPKTCATGCCDGDRCVTTHTTDKCGANGAACTKCNSCFRCSNAGACEVDPMSTWKIVCVAATLSSTKSNFQSWDQWDQMNGPGGPIGGGGPGNNSTDLLPDPFCQLSVGIGDNVVGTTAILDNTTTPRWNEAITSALSPLTAGQLTSQSTPWAITVQDDDGKDRPELACRVAPQLTASDFVSTDVTFNNVQSCLTLNLHLTCQSP